MITTILQGSFTTIQDEGRWGYQAYGMPTAGMMDRYAGRMANLLAGNQTQAAVIEMTKVGAAFKFDEEQLVAVCGADMQGRLNGVRIKNWSAFLVPRRGELRFDAAVSGFRTYLAVQGGFDVPLVLGSRSTCTRAKVGGYEGRALRQGDVLYVGGDIAGNTVPRRLSQAYIPQYGDEITLRVILGPQDNMFPPDAIAAFFAGSYKVGPRADRIGYELKGPKVKPIGKSDIVSDAMCQGAIQIIAKGQPVIMAADHQTTGGFAKLGFVIAADLPKLAQARPGSVIRFTSVTEAAAIEALRLEKLHYTNVSGLYEYEGI